MSMTAMGNKPCVMQVIGNAVAKTALAALALEEAGHSAADPWRGNPRPPSPRNCQELLSEMLATPAAAPHCYCRCSYELSSTPPQQSSHCTQCPSRNITEKQRQLIGRNGAGQDNHYKFWMGGVVS